jgi:hypothetical protein
MVSRTRLANAPLDGTTVTLASPTPVVRSVLEFKVSATKQVNTSNFTNHGDYVSLQGGGAMQPTRASECPFSNSSHL